MSGGRRRFTIIKTTDPVPFASPATKPLPTKSFKESQPVPASERKLTSDKVISAPINGTLNTGSDAFARDATVRSQPISQVSTSQAQSQLPNSKPLEAQSFPGASEPPSRSSRMSSLQPGNTAVHTSKLASSSPAPSAQASGSETSKLRKRAHDRAFNDSTPIPASKKMRFAINLEMSTKLSTSLNAAGESHFDWNRNALKLARRRSRKVKKEYDSSSPFDSMTPTVAATTAKKSGVVRLNRAKKTYKDRFEPISKSETRVEKIQYAASANNVPKFKHYTAVSQSIVAPEKQEIRVIPEVDQSDEEKQEGLEEELESHFGDVTEQRACDLKQRHLIASLLRPVGNFLADTGIEVETVLRYLLEPSFSEFPETLSDQRGPCFNMPQPQRDLDTADAFMLSQIGTETDLTLPLLHSAHDACAAVHDAVPELNVLELMRAIYEDKQGTSKGPKPGKTLKGHTCRICFQENCLLHGAFFDDENDTYTGRHVSVEGQKPQLCSIQPEETFATVMELNFYGLDEQGHLVAPPLKSNIFSSREVCCTECFWKKLNRQIPSVAVWSDGEIQQLEELLPIYAKDVRAPCAIAMFLESKTCIEIAHKALEMIQRRCDNSGTASGADAHADKRHGKLIRKIGRAHVLQNRQLFFPCSHTESCEEAQCSCWTNEVLCENFCMCPADCERRVQGCKCKRIGNICGTSQCPCFRMSRECDPDICESCGAHEILDPELKHNSGILEGRCRNVPNQRNVSKKTYMGTAQFGFGLFAGENIAKDEFISEYKGEVICRAEAERRGLTSAFMRNQYLFSINQDVDNDATFAANKTRHINHSSDERNINVYVRMTLCNGVTRLGMFAQTDIAVGDELLFNYHYTEKDLDRFYEKEGHRSIEVSKGLKGVRSADIKSVGRQRTSTGVPMAAAKNTVVDGVTAEQLYSGIESSQPDPEDDFATMPIPPDDDNDLDFVHKSSPRKGGSDHSDADTPRRQTRRRNVFA